MQTPEALMARIEAFFNDSPLPTACIHGCEAPRIVKNGRATRSASFLLDGRVHRLTGLPVRRVKCQTCRRSWRHYPPELIPRRHFQLCVVADIVATYVFGTATMQALADARAMARRTVSRFVRWVAGLVEPGQLLRRLLETVGSPIIPTVPPVRPVPRRILDGVRRRAAQVLVGLEALACAAGLEPPGLRAIVRRAIRHRDRATTHRRPAIPELARSGTPSG